MKNPKLFLKLAFLFLPFLILGCVYPKFAQEENLDCQLWTRELELDMSLESGGAMVEGMTQALSNCDRPECLLVVPLAILAIPVTSGIVSGSIVVVGNTIHWVEEQGRCEDSLTRTTLSALPATTLEAGGRVIQSGPDLIDWFQAQLTPDTQDSVTKGAQEENDSPSGNEFFKSP